MVADLDDPFCPLSKSSLFLNIVEDREKIDYLIEKLQKASDLVMKEAETIKIFSTRAASIGAVV